MNNFDQDYTDDKAKRREKLKKQNKKNYFIDDDNVKKQHIQKKEFKKIKESYQEEEWEDWDRHYNR